MKFDQILNGFNDAENYKVEGSQQLESRFCVTQLAAHSVASVGCAISKLVQSLQLSAERPQVCVNSHLASHWFKQSIYPIDWELAPAWDNIAGDYQSRDGWIRLHTNLPHHRQAALSVLGCSGHPVTVAQAIISESAEQLELAIVAAGGVAAQMRPLSSWLTHPHGRTLAQETLVQTNNSRRGYIRAWPATLARPLNGLKVLDLTRVLAGPVATRALAGFGAQVLRIDPFGWNEAFVVPDITLGKRCAQLDLKSPQGKEQFNRLLEQADVLIHGYRPGVLSSLGFDQASRARIAPQLIEIQLNAYGWTGPWKNRRGFDSLVQMSCGIADAGMDWKKSAKPIPLPVQALDHSTGYLAAAAAIYALDQAVNNSELHNSKVSLARTALLLTQNIQAASSTLNSQPQTSDFSANVEVTPWGKAKRLIPPLNINGVRLAWDRPACELGSENACWV